MNPLPRPSFNIINRTRYLKRPKKIVKIKLRKKPKTRFYEPSKMILMKVPMDLWKDLFVLDDLQ